MNFREKLIQLRTQSKMSQQELADLLGVSRQTVSRWEAGKNTPSAAQIANICRAFNIQANDLMQTPSDEGRPSPQTESDEKSAPAPQRQVFRATPLLIAIGILLIAAAAGLIITIIYAVKDSVYDTSATVWIAALPQNTPFVILSIFIVVFIIVLVALFITILRGRKK